MGVLEKKKGSSWCLKLWVTWFFRVLFFEACTSPRLKDLSFGPECERLKGSPVSLLKGPPIVRTH